MVRRILIGDNTLNFGKACVNLFNAKLFDVVTVERDAVKILEAVKTLGYDILVLGTLNQVDETINLIKQIRLLNLVDLEIVILDCSQNNEQSNYVTLENIDLCIQSPFQIQDVCNKVTNLANSKKLKVKNPLAQVVDLSNESDDLEVIVTDVILLIGIPAHVKGYHYIRCAIINCIENPTMLNSVTKILYPTVAKEFDTSSSRVERAIRHAIEIAWDRGDIDTLNSYFGYTINNQRGKPTNSEFIAMISDKLRLKLKTILAKKND